MPEGKLESVSDMDHRDMTKEQALQEIGRIVGFRGFSRTQLRKKDLNSIYWYLTGSTVARWQSFGTARSPTYILLRKAVADEVGFAYRDSWTSSRPYRRNELQSIVYSLRNSEDHRQHAN